MIRVLESKEIRIDKQNPAYYREFAGLSTDRKPTDNLATGSVFIEVDTGDAYLYDEASSAWKKVEA